MAPALERTTIPTAATVRQTYGLRTNYDRDYGRRYSAGYGYYAGRPSYSGLSLGFGFSRYYGDSVSLGFGYSSGPRYYGYGGPRYYGYGPRYYAGRPYYVPAPVIVAPRAPVVYSGSICPPGYYDGRGYYYDNGGSSYYYDRSYYGR